MISVYKPENKRSIPSCTAAYLAQMLGRPKKRESDRESEREAERVRERVAKS